MILTLEKAKEVMHSNGGNLVLGNTDYTELPEGLVVIRDLDLQNSEIAHLPNDLVVGGSIRLRNSNVSHIPASLKVGGKVYSDFKFDKRVNKSLKDGTYVSEKYIYAGHQIVFVSRTETIDNLTFYVGEKKDINVLSDGNKFVVCKSYDDGLEWFIHKPFQKFKKYFLQKYQFEFKSSVPFAELGFENGNDLLDYVTEHCEDGLVEPPIVFDSLEAAQKALSKEYCWIHEQASGTPGFTIISGNVPYIEEFLCDEDIKTYGFDMDCDMWDFKTIAVADL